MLLRTDARQYGIATLLGLVFVALKMDSLWGFSVDVAHHYALAYRLAENWTLVPNDPSLGEMNFYPRGSHILAAIMGRIFGSVFMGMQFIALTAVFLIWGGLFYLLRTLPERQAILSMSVLVLALLVNRRLFALELHGTEIVGNFFFSQVVGQAFAVLMILFAIRAEQSERKSLAALILWAAAFVASYIHLLPALELLGILVGLLAAEGFSQGFRRKNWWFLLGCIALSALAVLSICLNPNFLAMRRISENNGALSLAHVSYPFGMVLLCMATYLGALASFVVYSYKKQEKAYCLLKYLALYGAVLASLCMLQLLLSMFGEGSDYAVKKYGFGLLTYIFLNYAVLLAQMLSRLPGLSTFDWSNGRSAILGTVFPPLCLILMLLCALPKSRLFDVSGIVQEERQLSAVTALAVRTDPTGKPNVIIDVKRNLPQLNYMFSIAIAGTPRSLAIPDILQNDSLADIGAYANIIQSNDAGRYISQGCKTYAAGDIAVVSANCLARSRDSIGECRGRYDLSYAQSAQFLLKGFGRAEDGGRWTNGKSAVVSCRLQGEPPAFVDMLMSPFLFKGGMVQRVEFSINGQVVKSELLAHAGVQQVQLKVPKDVKGENLVISLSMPDAISPHALGISQNDDRELGVSMRSISFEQ